MTEKKIALIGAQLGWGAQVHETQWGPDALVEFGVQSALLLSGIDVYWRTQVKPTISFSSNNPQLDKLQIVDEIIDFNQTLATIVLETMRDDEFPVVIGGDHAIAMGTWTAVVNFFETYEDFGLIWIDAHLDAHTPDTSHSQAIHGMPVAHLLGLGDKRLSDLLRTSRKINPDNLIYIGVRSFEPEEHALIQSLGIKIYDMTLVNEKGFSYVLREAIEFLEQKVAHIGISFDVDAFDPEVAPGVGSPEKGGLMPTDVLTALNGMAYHPKICAFEIAEFNPQLDREEKTAYLIQELLLSFFKK